MTKQDYIRIAKCFQGLHTESTGEGACLALMTRLARTLAEDNPRFDRDKFVEACKREWRGGL